MQMPRKVLICDDERYILEAVSFVVEEEGYLCVTAEDGEQCLQAARTETPDLIILDIMMPKKDGFQVCRELKSDPATRGIYIIMLTAMGQGRDREEGERCGADEYMTKPFSPRNLRQRLQELLDASQ